jgi:outer membrane protein
MSNSKIHYTVHALLFVAIIILFILHFSGSCCSERVEQSSEKTSFSDTIQKSAVHVAYLNSDRILEEYELVKNMKSDLEKTSVKWEKEIAGKQAAFEKDAAYFQEQVARKSISEESATRIYDELMKAQQDIVDLRDQYANRLAEKEYEMNMILVDTVTNFLNRYNNGQFDYIFGMSKGGNIFLANDAFDITNIVLQNLNEEYAIKSNPTSE